MSKINAFEADNKILNILKENTKNIDNIEYYNNAVWINSDTLLDKTDKDYQITLGLYYVNKRK